MKLHVKLQVEIWIHLAELVKHCTVLQEFLGALMCFLLSCFMPFLLCPEQMYQSRNKELICIDTECFLGDLYTISDKDGNRESVSTEHGCVAVSRCLCRTVISVSRTGNCQEKSENLPQLGSVSYPVVESLG